MKMWSTRRFSRSFNQIHQTLLGGDVVGRNRRHPDPVERYGFAGTEQLRLQRDTEIPVRRKLLQHFGVAVEGHDLFRRGNTECLIPQLLRPEVIGVAVSDENLSEFRQIEPQFARLHRSVGTEIELDRIAQQISGTGTASPAAVPPGRRTDWATAEYPWNSNGIP